MLLTRSGSLTGLNALPSAIKSYDDVLNAIAIINPWLSNLEIAPIDVAPPRVTDFSGSKVSGTLLALVPKLTTSLQANVVQSKALKKIIGVVTSAIEYLLSAEYEEEITERIVNSETFARLLDRKLDERLEARGSGGVGGPHAGEGRQAAARPRKERQTDLEIHLHYVVHRSINKAFDTGALTVASELRTWPDGTEEGFFDEVVGGRTLRRWRPIWENIPRQVHALSLDDGPFENDVVSKVLQEWPDTYTDQQVRKAFRAYRANIVREKKKQDEGRQGEIRAERRVTKRTGDLLDSMRRYFEKSALNRCSDRAFYQSMIDSQAFRLVRVASNEAHGLPTPATRLPDGADAGFDGFQLYAELWDRRRVSEPMWAAKEDPWWSEKARFAFFLLLEESKPKEDSRQKARTAMFHLPAIARPAVSASCLPKLAAPSSSATDQPRASKRARPDACQVSEGMVTSSITNDPAVSTWASLLLQDPEPDASLPTLDEVLKSTPEYVDLERRTRQHLRVDRDLTYEQARQLWRIRTIGSEQQYDEALRASDLAAHLEGVDWDNLGELYD